MALSAENEQETTATCLVCFEETAELKTVGPSCRHSFCVKCLDIHLSKQPQGFETFPCPGCQQECPLPSSGVYGLDDWSHEVTAAESILSLAENDKGGAKNSQMSDPSCQLCEYKGKPVSNAEFCCEKCKNTRLCKACADEHHNLPATRHHVVTSLAETTTGYAECASHNLAMDLYCSSCDTTGCSMCVLLEHGEHDVVELEKMIRRNLDELKERIAKGTDRIREFEQLRQETMAARDIVLNWRDRKIQQVEEATEKAIKRLLDQKEKLKKEIKTGCDISELTDLLGIIQDVEQVFRDVLKKGERTLDETSLNQNFLAELRKAVTQFDVAVESDIVQGDLHWNRLRNPLPLYKENRCDKETDLRYAAVFEPDVIAKADQYKSILYTDNDIIISSVIVSAGLNEYAIAYYHSNDPGSCQCHIRDHYYDTSDEFRQKLTLGVNGIIDMAATPDGRLAVLHSDKDQADAMVIRQICTADNDLIGDAVCRNLEKAVSFTVNILGQYIVVSNKDEDAQEISVLNKGGGIVCTFEPVQRDLRRVVCGGRYFYTLGMARVDVYEMTKGKVHFVKSLKSSRRGNIDDITATLADDVFASASRQTVVDVFKLLEHGEDCQFRNPLLTIQDRGGESRIDIRDGWMIISHGRYWRLYQLNNESS